MKTMLIDVKSKPKTCPKCGGRIVDIIYGMPSPETYERALRGEVMLGGCCIARDEHGRIMDPKWGCADCERQFRVVR